MCVCRAPSAARGRSRAGPRSVRYARRAPPRRAATPRTSWPSSSRGISPRSARPVSTLMPLLIGRARLVEHGRDMAAMSRERARVAGVVLAAGASSRMGENKLFLRLGGSTVLRRAAGTAAAAGLDPVLVVVGHDGERARAELAGLPGVPVDNPNHARGINTSLAAGIAAVPDDCGAAIVLLADMPLVTAGMVRALVERFRSGDAPLVLSVYGDVLAPPTLYGRALFPELGAPEGEGCGKRVVARHRGDAAELAWPSSRLADVDVPADLERVRAELDR